MHPALRPSRRRAQYYPPRDMSEGGMVDKMARVDASVGTAAPQRARLAWSDWLLQRLEAAPLPLWVTLVLLTAVGVVVLHAIEWWLGPLEVGTFELYRASVPFYPFGVLGAVAVQYRITRGALRQFRPAVPAIDDGEYARIEHRLTHQPAGASVVAGLAVAVLGIISIVTSPTAEARRLDYPVVFGIDLALTLVTYAFAGPWLIGVYRLLRAVNGLHQRASVIDLFQPGPLHAFSTVTAVISASLVAVVTFAAVTDPASTASSSGLVLSAIITALAAACFIVPLWGMHRRLQAERRRLASEAATRIERVRDQLYGQVDRDEPGAAEAKDRLDALLSLRTLIAGLSTWPWRPETPRWLVSALLVPIVLWGVTRFLERAGL